MHPSIHLSIYVLFIFLYQDLTINNYLYLSISIYIFLICLIYLTNLSDLSQLSISGHHCGRHQSLWLWPGCIPFCDGSVGAARAWDPFWHQGCFFAGCHFGWPTPVFSWAYGIDAPKVSRQTSSPVLWNQIRHGGAQMGTQEGSTKYMVSSPQWFHPHNSFIPTMNTFLIEGLLIYYLGYYKPWLYPWRDCIQLDNFLFSKPTTHQIRLTIRYLSPVLFWRKSLPSYMAIIFWSQRQLEVNDLIFAPRLEEEKAGQTTCAKLVAPVMKWESAWTGFAWHMKQTQTGLQPQRPVIVTTKSVEIKPGMTLMVDSV